MKIRSHGSEDLRKLKMRWTKIRWNIIAEESKKRHTDNWEWDQSTLGWDKKCNV